MARIAVKPDLLRWARERAGKDVAQLRQKFPKLDEWDTQTAQPTTKQLERYAKATYTPFGYFFLERPPEDRLPIPFFRTGLATNGLVKPSPNLLDTVQTMLRRQAWLREVLIAEGEDRFPHAGTARPGDEPGEIAERIRIALGLVNGWARQQPTWTAALGELRNAMDEAGIVVATNGVVGNNTHRKLDPGEFRGFVLVDDYAPFVFVNGADAKAAQMFTLAHELAHLWLGQSAAFDLRELHPAADATELACNAIAAEFLVPQAELQEAWGARVGLGPAFDRLARQFKVSAIVVARRSLDLGLVTKPQFLEFYREYAEQVSQRAAEKSDGGDFYALQNVRLGRRFALAVSHAVGEGRLTYREAFTLTGLWGRTFDRYAAELRHGRRSG